MAATDGAADGAADGHRYSFADTHLLQELGLSEIGEKDIDLAARECFWCAASAPSAAAVDVGGSYCR